MHRDGKSTRVARRCFTGFALAIGLTSVTSLLPAWAAGQVQTIAGSGNSCGDGGPATKGCLYYPMGVSVDGAGNLYIADYSHMRIRKVSGSGVITTLAGSGRQGFCGDGGPATKACLAFPTGVVVDPEGSVYIADTFNHRIRKVTPSGTISTFAGNGSEGYCGDDGPATSACLALPSAVALDRSGNLYVSDSGNNRIRKVTPSGMIATVAGNGTAGYCGDGGLATIACLKLSRDGYSFPYPAGVGVDSSGNLYIADAGNNRVRKVSPSGTITTVAGSGEGGWCGDAGPAAGICLRRPRAVAVDGDGNLYIADVRIRRVTPSGMLDTLAGDCSHGVLGDGGPASSACFSGPVGITLDPSGNIYVGDSNAFRVRKFRPSGIIETVAGNGSWGWCGDGGPGTSACLSSPSGVAVDPSGNLYVADSDNNRIRKVTPSGQISTIAGNGWSLCGYGNGDGGSATDACLAGPTDVALDLLGNIYIAEWGRIRKVAPSGIITTVAGSGTGGDPHYYYCGDGGPATRACLHQPVGIALNLAGDLFIADSGNNRIRKVSAATGAISTVAGNGSSSFCGDGGPAVDACFDFPSRVAVDLFGNIYIADSYNHRIREVSATTGTISTVAGNGTDSFCGDGGPATSACLNFPLGVTVDGSGDLLIADTRNYRLRKVTRAGIIHTVAGIGTADFCGDGEPAASACLNDPMGVAFDPLARELYVADSANDRVRKVAV